VKKFEDAFIRFDRIQYTNATDRQTVRPTDRQTDVSGTCNVPKIIEIKKGIATEPTS